MPHNERREDGDGDESGHADLVRQRCQPHVLVVHELHLRNLIPGIAVLNAVNVHDLTDQPGEREREEGRERREGVGDRT